MKLTRFRAAGIAIFSLFILTLSLLFFLQLSLPFVAYFVPALKTPFYDLGVYGASPKQDYISCDLSAPHAITLQWDPRCDKGFVLLTPSGKSVPRPGLMILDSRGRLVWFEDSYGDTTNLKVQRYRGQDYLTFWSGEHTESSGKGVYYVVSRSYLILCHTDHCKA